MSLVNLDFINIAHGIDNTRIYKKDKELFCYTVNLESIIPFSTLKAANMASHINQILLESWGDINLMLNYKRGTYNKKKMKKLRTMLEYEKCLSEDEKDTVSEKELLKWIMFLF